MGRLVDGNPALSSLRLSVFSSLAARLRAHQGPVYPLHVGDTYLPPPAGALLEEQTEALEPGIHRYENPRGRRELIQTIVEHHRAGYDWGHPTPDNALVTVGATGGLSATVRALTVPGQTILLLAPYWPLIRGMSVSHGLTVREVPFYDRVDSPEATREVLRSALDDSVAAIYVNWPNNPSGRLSSPEVVEAVAAFAQQHDLWLISDEVYDRYVYQGTYRSPASFEGTPNRTIQAFSFSKAYGMAGNRVGYLIGPSDAIGRIARLTTYLVYCACRGAQRGAMQALRNGQQWLAAAHRAYAAIGRETAERLAIDPPQGGTFHFFDVAEHLDERGVPGFLEDCVARGLLVAPGEIFGQGYETFVRLCFTCAPPGQVREGVEILAQLMGR